MIHRVFFVVVLCVFICPVVTRAAKSPTYNQLQALRLNLVANGSFEKASRSDKYPAAKWGVVKKYGKVIRNASKAFHGTRFVRYRVKKGGRTLYGRFKRPASGKIHLTAHLRGSGKARLTVALMTENYKQRPNGKKFLKLFHSAWLKVHSAKWQTMQASFDIPKKVHGAPVAYIRLHVRIHGRVDVDAVSAYKVSSWQKAAPAKRSHKNHSAPILTIPHLVSAPAIDGVMEKGEWARAAAVTGFSALNSQTLSKRQTTVFIGYGDQNIYVAYRSRANGRPKGKLAHRDGKITPHMDMVELWLDPPDQPWTQFLVAPNGAGGVGKLDVRQDQGLAWNGQWLAAAKSVGSGQRVGGVLTFQNATWAVEIAVPFQTLGLSGPPTDGSRWRINFTRDHAAQPGKSRTMSDWTSWSPIQGRFDAIKQFGTAVFIADAPAVQVMKLSELGRGDESVAGQVHGNDEKVHVTLRVSPASDSGKTLVFGSDTVGKGGGAFIIQQKLKLNVSQKLSATLSATDDAGKVLTRQTLHFRNQPALGLKLVQNPAKHILWANIDTRRVANLASIYRIETKVYQNGQAADASAKAMWQRPRDGDIKIDTTKLKPGNYELHAKAINPATGKVLATSSRAFTVPKKPVWLDNTLGISNKVPKPWTPIQWNANKQTVSITQRTYWINAQGLPDQITALGKKILARPATLVAVVDGQKVQWQGALAAPTHVAGKKIVWPIDLRGGGLRVLGTLTIEFDGFARWNVEVSAEHPVQLDALYLNFPMRAYSALYARARDVVSGYGTFYSAALYNPGKPKAIDIAGMQFSSAGWAWPDHWMQAIFVGGDLRGFSVANETDQYRIGPLRTQILRRNGVRTLRINLVSKPIELNKPLKYDITWQATPVKPTPKNFKLWTANYRPYKTPAYLNNAGITLDMWSLKHSSYPEFRRSRSSFERHNRKLLAHGINVVPYVGTGLIATQLPALKPWRNLWKRQPYRTFSQPNGVSGSVSVEAGSLRDYYAWMFDNIVHRMGMGGVYMDVSGITGSTNKYQGSGYQPADGGVRKPTVDVYAQRKLYKRLWKISKAGGKNKVLMHHQQPIAAVAGFVDVTLQGEGWGPGEGKKEYDRLTPDFFRVQIMRRQFGTPHTWYTFNHYYRGMQNGRIVPLWEILTYCLPFHTLPAAGDPGMGPVWALFKSWWTSAKFVGYWQKGFPLNINKHLVLSAVYLKPKEDKALVVVANWNTSPRKVTLNINPQKLGLPAGPVQITRALKHPIHANYKQAGHDPEPPIQVSGNQVTMHLDGRNLEVLLVKVKP